jgi:hypothetical protein
MAIIEMFIKNIIILSTSKRTSFATILFELLKAVLHKIVAKSAHLYFLKIKTFYIHISRSSILNCKKYYIFVVFIASFISISLMIWGISILFLIQNAPIVTAFSNSGFLYFQPFIVCGLLLTVVPISFSVIFSISKFSNMFINKYLISKYIQYETYLSFILCLIWNTFINNLFQLKQYERIRNGKNNS